MLDSALQIDSFGVSDVGLVREHNEDVLGVYPEQGLFLVADGMGGAAAGEVASAAAGDALAAEVKNWIPLDRLDTDEASRFFRNTVAEINREIYKRAQANPELTGMGTTICALYFLGTEAVVAHVGDSRVYRWRDGVLEHLTKDHSLVAEMAVDEEELDTFPYRHVLTRAIGTNPSVEPTVSTVDVHSNDIFLLCSDGLTNYVTDLDIDAILKRGAPLADRGQALITLANRNGGGDNVTVVLTEISDDLPG